MSNVTHTPVNGKAPETLKDMSAGAVRSELDRILKSRAFVHSHRMRRFLQFVVEECLSGQQSRLKEYLIGLEVFNRMEQFDPRIDSIVRVEARRLRSKLEEYYQTEGREAELRIELRKGSYVPLFEFRRPGMNGYGHVPTPERRSSVVIGSIVGDWPELIADVNRRLTHVLINEGFCHVVGSGDGHTKNGSAAPDYVIEGSVSRDSAATKLMFRLRDESDGSYFSSVCCDAGVDGIEEVARVLNRSLITAHSRAENRNLQRRRAQSHSFDDYLRGRYLWKAGNPESIRSSTALFQSAVEKDPAYSAAWGALAESVVVGAVFGSLNPSEARTQILDAANKAMVLNDRLPEAHVALGAAFSIFDWHWQKGEHEFQRAIQLDGRDPSGHVAYSLQLAARGMLGPAMVEAERALELDPASLANNFVLGWLFSAAKKHDQAVLQHNSVLRLAPDFSLAYLGLGWANAGMGMYGDAIACFTNAGNQLKCRGLLWGCLGYCYARMGNRGEAMRLMELLKKQASTQYTSSVHIAAIHSGLGQRENALTCLEQAAEARCGSLALQLLNPEFECLRHEVRYRQLLDRMGLGS